MRTSKRRPGTPARSGWVLVVLGCSSLSCADLLGVDDLRFDLEEEDTIVGPGCVARGPNVVNIDGKFCIDSTEVTYAEYATFLASNPAPQTDDACSWNTFVPSTGWPGTNPQLPVAHVDFCDARGYCAWAGKRLCGEIGGGSFAFGAFPGNRLKTELYYACSHAGDLNFPYGNSYDPSACATDVDSSWPAGISESCEGGFDGVFDLSGNVAEWQDSCFENDGYFFCRLGSHGFASLGDTTRPGSHFACAEDYFREVQSETKDTGIRCCSDAAP